MYVSHENENVIEITFPAPPYKDGGNVASYCKVDFATKALNFDFGWIGYEFFTNLETGTHFAVKR